MVAPREISTNRLTLRPPVSADRNLWMRLSLDPALWAHASRPMPASEAEAAADFDACLEGWRSAGFDLGVVEESLRGTTVGFGGVRPVDSGDRLGLTFCFDAAVHGRGLAREAGRAWSAHALEWLPDVPLVAFVGEHNIAAARTARTVGMEPAGSTGPDGEGPPATVFAAPRVEVRERLDEETRAAVLDLWCAVNDDGGAVGFLPGAARSAVAKALSAHEEQMADGTAVAVLLRATGGSVVGLGFWVGAANPMLAHTRTGYRIMTDPTRRGRNLGRLQLAAMHRVARARAVELVTVGVRSGLGITRFYERAGYDEVGRVPGGIRVAPGDDRDDIVLARRLDGRPMVDDGRA